MCSIAKLRRTRHEMTAPKPVRPVAISAHGLFGIPNVRQHMILDDRWTPNSLTEQYKGMTDLLERYRVFKELEISANRKVKINRFRDLRREVRDGRHKLFNVLSGNNQKVVRNILINHKDMQRLYQKMPLHMAVDNINQRTFVMRKERDRLQHRLDHLKNTYQMRLLERADIENRIKYQNEFVVEEELKQNEYRKKIENSNVRLRAIQMINSTYKKMIQGLEHDAIFYEPILQSLHKDMEDQERFIEQILYLGKPGIKKFEELSKEYRMLEDKFRKTMSKQPISDKKSDQRASLAVRNTLKEDPINTAQRFVRETDSMMMLKNGLEAIENIIKEVKQATLTSSSKEIYPRIKGQVENNEELRKNIDHANLMQQHLTEKMKFADVLQGVLVNNLSEEELARLARIKELQDAIHVEEDYERNTILYLKNMADGYVLLRFSLWNLYEQLRFIDPEKKYSRKVYPNSYLSLPLLRFEMIQLRAVPPDMFEESLENLMARIKKKVQKLMNVYPKEITEAEVKDYRDQFHGAILEAKKIGYHEESEEQTLEEDEDLITEHKTMLNVPNRKQIKTQSAKLVEEYAKRDVE